MAQKDASYPEQIGKFEKEIIEKLSSKYSFRNVIWPLVWIKNNLICWYSYEKNNENQINDLNDSRPNSSNNLKSHFVDYTKSPRKIDPTNTELIPSTDATFQTSHKYVTTPGCDFATVDLDYTWLTKDGWKAIELTTFFVPIENVARAIYLASQIRKRKSWSGPGGEQAMRRQIEAANDLKIDYYLVGVNTHSSVDTRIKYDGNCFIFKLTNENLDKLTKGETPESLIVMSMKDFLDWL